MLSKVLKKSKNIYNSRNYLIHAFCSCKWPVDGAVLKRQSAFYFDRFAEAEWFVSVVLTRGLVKAALTSIARASFGFWCCAADAANFSAVLRSDPRRTEPDLEPSPEGWAEPNRTAVLLSSLRGFFQPRAD